MLAEAASLSGGAISVRRSTRTASDEDLSATRGNERSRAIAPGFWHNSLLGQAA